MDRYQKVEKPKPESPVNENEIRITSQGLVRNYVSYATSLLQERKSSEIVLKAMGQAISKTVAIAEIIKKRVPRLHQDTTISSVSITDTFEPIEEGLQIVEQTRHVSMISIILSTKDLNMNSPGYQAPSHMDQSRLQHIYLPQQRQPPRQARGGYNSGIGDTYGRGGHGPDRGRDWNRGGYSNYLDNGGYSGGSAGYSGDNGGYRGGYAGGNAGYRGGYAGGNSGNRGGYAGRNSGYRGGYAGGNSGNRGGYAGGNSDYRRGYAGGNGGYRGGYSGGNGGYQGSHSGGYRTWGRGDGRGDYHGDAYGRGRGGGGRGFGRGRGRMGSRGLAAV